MKKIILLICIISSQTLMAQNVGIGTAIPVQKLHVEGATYLNGNVGIGNSTPAFPISFAPILGDKISLWSNTTNSYGFGIQSSQLQIHTDIAAADIVLGYGSSAAFFETMRIKGNGNVGIGTTMPASKLHIKGSGDISQLTIDANATQSNTQPLIRLRNAAGVDLLHIHSDNPSNTFIGLNAGRVNNFSSGGRSNTFTGADAGYSNTTGGYNTANGQNALYSCTTGGSNTANGQNALYFNTTGGYNTANGQNALYSNTTGGNNTANGQNALFFNTTGSINTANGQYALYSNTTGGSNTANGRQALYSNTTGNNNTANGVQALYTNTTGESNTANGVQALYFNTTGVNNNANGMNALFANTTGFHNTANGVSALFANTTGNNNTANGGFALYSNTTGSNNTALGNSAFSSGASFSNSTALGYNANITASDQVRVGDVNVNSIGGQVGWTTLSDKRFKKDITETIPGLSFIMKLRPVAYHLDMNAIAGFLKTPDSLRLKDAEITKGNMLQTGFIAQEVEQAAKQINFDFGGIDKPKNNNDYYGLRYAEFVVPLVKAVQEQQTIIQNQQKQIDELKILVQKLIKQ